MKFISSYRLAMCLLMVMGIAPAAYANESYWLVIGSYRQGPGSRPEVSGITSPSLYAIQMDSLKACENAGRKISDKIFKPVWQFDNRWTCVAGAQQK